MGVDKVDKIWKTCCALHNRLLEVDGLDKEWVNGTQQSIWEGRLGQHNKDEIPFLICHLHSPQQICHFDVSGMGPGNDREALPTLQSNSATQAGNGDNATTHKLKNAFEGHHHDQQQEQAITSQQPQTDNTHLNNASNHSGQEEQAQIVRNMTLRQFCNKLVEHFLIKFQCGEVVWPSNKKCSAPPPESDLYNLF